MEAVAVSKSSENDCESISASPDFAQIYVFIQNFGKLLKLPFVNLSDLEQFFIDGYLSVDTHISYIQWRLLSTSQRGSQKDWHKAASKFARALGLCDKDTQYCELPVVLRVKLFRLSCEDQFDYNVYFKNELKKEGVMETCMHRPLLGVDSKGKRHWLLKDDRHDIRLYGESCYNEESPNAVQWVEIAKSLDDFADYIAILGSSRGNREPSPSEANLTADQDLLRSPANSSSSQSQTMSASNLRGKRSGRMMKSKDRKSRAPKTQPVWDGDLSINGCIKCRKDVDYQQMLLCDECNRECHTYCQYPKLWVVPKGKWICPICKEGHLLEELRGIYFKTSTARANHERSVQRKQKSIARLQRSGLLLQNIIMENGEEECAGRRPRRSRKEINYAELNDVQLPRLGPDDFVQSGNDYSTSRPVSKRKRMNQHIQEDCPAPHSERSSWRQREIQDVRKVEKPSRNGHSFLDEENSGYTDGEDELSSVSLFEGNNFESPLGYESSDEVDSVSSGIELMVTFQRDREDQLGVHKVHSYFRSNKKQDGSTISTEDEPSGIPSKQVPLECTEYFSSHRVSVDSDQQCSTDDDSIEGNDLLCLAHLCSQGENQSVGPNSQCLDSESSDIDVI